MKLLFIVSLITFLSSSLFSLTSLSIDIYENKIENYINMPKLSKEENSNNKLITQYIKSKKLKEAYDILYKWMKEINDENYQSLKARYILIRIAHIYIYSEMWEPALNAMIEVMNYKNSVGNPLLHLRVGQIAYKLTNKNIYEDNLSRALIMGGLKVFENEDKILRNIPIKILKKPKDSNWEQYEGQDWKETK